MGKENVLSKIYEKVKYIEKKFLKNSRGLRINNWRDILINTCECK